VVVGLAAGSGGHPGGRSRCCSVVPCAVAQGVLPAHVSTQTVVLAWHTRYTYDKAMDTILQCNASLFELGQSDDAFVLAKQMATLCRQRFTAAHPVSYEAAESVTVIRQARRKRRAAVVTDRMPRPAQVR